MLKIFTFSTFIRLSLTLLSVSAANAQAVAAQPMVGYIDADEVYLRSGPGQSYYPTGQLKRGESIQVFRQDPGGWCAIRPPEGSFTWVSARYLKVGRDGLAEVTADRVAARIGSSLSTARESISIYLKRGEIVELYDPNPKSDAQWYRIYPPAGEFRWVSSKFVDFTGSARGVRSASASTSPIVAGRLEHIAGFDTPDVAPAVAPRPATAPRDTYYSSAAGRVPEAQSPYRATDPYASAPAVASTTGSNSSMRDAVGTLELDFSRMVAEDPSTWQFEALWERARSLHRNSTTAVERGRLQTLAERISRFESIRQNYTQIASMEYGNQAYRRRVIDTASPRNPAVASVAARPEFDGIGRLRRVTGPEWDDQAPTFALMDDMDQVRAFVTAAPGVEPQRYEGRTVGVNGQKEYLLRQRAHHIMATHIQPLDGTTLR